MDFFFYIILLWLFMLMLLILFSNLLTLVIVLDLIYSITLSLYSITLSFYSITLSFYSITLSFYSITLSFSLTSSINFSYSYNNSTYFSSIFLIILLNYSFLPIKSFYNLLISIWYSFCIDWNELANYVITCIVYCKC